MSFREKSAWVTLVAILFVSVLYVLHVPRVIQGGHWALVALMTCVGTFIAIEVVAWVALRLFNPTEARSPKDELEKLIELKALRIAAYVYFVGSFVAIFITLHLHGGAAHVVAMSVLIAFIVAEVVNYTARIVYYRRHA